MLSVVFNDEGAKASELLRKATQKKDEGKIEEAIEVLKKAYKEISKTNIDYSIETFLRLPLYLQAANRSEEAWNEFNCLLKNGYPNQNKIKELIPMVESNIYDKMRLFLQREKQFDKAVSYGSFSIICQALGLFYQKRNTEFKAVTEKSHLIERITPLLKKSKKLHLLAQTIDIVQNSLDEIPNISFENFTKKVEAILNFA